jgi:hypothetical protein
VHCCGVLPVLPVRAAWRGRRAWCSIYWDFPAEKKVELQQAGGGQARSAKMHKVVRWCDLSITHIRRGRLP